MQGKAGTVIKQRDNLFPIIALKLSFHIMLLTKFSPE